MYEFRNVEDFVAHLDNRAKAHLTSAKRYHERSHARCQHNAAAVECELIANMVRESNLVAIADFTAAATVVKR
jgi:hypothetical protein